MPRKYTIRSKEEKLSIVKRNLAGESAMSVSGYFYSIYHARQNASKRQLNINFC